MAPLRIAHVLGTAFLIAVFLAGGPATRAVAQSPRDLYQTGPDPIAPELPPADRDLNEDAQTEPPLSGQESSSKEAEQPNDKDDLDLLDLNLKDLSQVAVKSASPAMNEEVSTVSRTESTVGRSPSAVYVITNDMIRHSGARNLPEALRLVPGVQVAQVTKTTWAISIRGFNARYANSLLVQIDGRAVYTPGFGGVYWDQQQVLLDDVERIEVIRGPGATVWGANAVNGVINIVTKPCDETQGLLVQSGGGDEHRSFNALRGGGRQGDLRWRLSGIQADDAPGYTTLPGGPWDSLQLGQGSFRMDWTPSRRDTLTLQGDFLGEKETFRLFEFLGPEQREPEDVRATNFLGRWTRKLDDETDWTVQMYYDNWQRLAVGGVYQLQNQNTFDLDSQYHAKMGDRHDVVCGFGYRNYEMTLDVQGPSEYTFVPPYNAFDIISYFAQDTIELRPDRLYATLGIKFEHNDFTNFEYQPSAKLLWSPDERTAFWGSISRAVRTPSVAERDIVLYGGLIRGTRSLRSEDLLAYELGMRRQPSDRLYWDLAVFYNRYDNLIGTYPVFPPPSSTANIGYGGTYGYELLVTYEMNPNWRLRGAYSFLVEDISYGASGGPFYVNPDSNPRNQSFLHSTWNLSQTVTFDMILRYVDRLATGVPRYLVMDVRLGWEPRKNLELAVVGQNLLDDHHPEFNDFFGVTEVPAGVYGMVSWRY